MITNNDTIISAHNIHKTYSLDRTKQHVLRGVSLKVARGEFVAIMGASGSGKSTLLHILGLLDRPDKNTGRVYFEDQDVFTLSGTRQDRIRRRDIGFVFQFYHLLPELNVQENIMMPLMVDASVISWPGRRSAARKRVAEILDAVNLSGKARQKPATLSGGERQRVALARAIVQKPKLLLADEPTGNLDSAAGQSIMKLLTRLNESGQSIIMVTHDPAIAAKAHRKMVLRDGKIG